MDDGNVVNSIYITYEQMRRFYKFYYIHKDAKYAAIAFCRYVGLTLDLSNKYTWKLFTSGYRGWNECYSNEKNDMRYKCSLLGNIFRSFARDFEQWKPWLKTWLLICECRPTSNPGKLPKDIIRMIYKML